MVNVLMFKGDVRVEIAESAGDEYEGLLHMILLEYFITENLTLCYFFDMDDQDCKRVFTKKEDWILNYAIKLEGTEKALLDVVETKYFLNFNIEDSILGDDDIYYISKCKNNPGIMLFQDIESILAYKTVIKEYEIVDEHGSRILKERKIKKYGIRIDEGYSSSPIDFDTLEELKEILLNKYGAKQLIPIVYTPWDSTDIKMNEARKIEDLTLLYLYEEQVFEVRTY